PRLPHRGAGLALRHVGHPRAAPLPADRSVPADLPGQGRRRRRAPDRRGAQGVLAAAVAPGPGPGPAPLGLRAVTRKILLVTPFGALGGAERVLAGLARHLPEHGWEPTIAMLQPGPAEEHLQLACPVEVLDSGRIRHLHRGAATVQGVRK